MASALTWVWHSKSSTQTYKKISLNTSANCTGIMLCWKSDTKFWFQNTLEIAFLLVCQSIRLQWDLNLRVLLNISVNYLQCAIVSISTQLFQLYNNNYFREIRNIWCTERRIIIYIRHIIDRDSLLTILNLYERMINFKHNFICTTSVIDLKLILLNVRMRPSMELSRARRLRSYERKRMN